MAIDTAEKRRSAGGVAFLPLGPGVTPNAAPDQEWRQESGWNYSGILTNPPLSTPRVIVPASGLIGAAQTTYFVRISDAHGNPMPDLTALYQLRVAVGVGRVGSVSLVTSGDYPKEYLKKDGVIEVWRVPQNRAPYLLLNKIFFLRRPRKTISGGRRLWHLTAYDANYLIADPSGQRGRIVAYPAGSAYSSKTEPADDMIKAIARENVGALATDSARDLSAYLAIQDDYSLAPTISKAFSNRVLLPVYNEICQASATAGTYLAWDIVCTAPPSLGDFGLELQTFIGSRGIDRRASAGDPILIGTDFGNLDDVEIDDDWTAEETSLRAGGKGEGAARLYVEDADATRLAESPFNRRESFLNLTNTADPAVLADEIDARLRAGTPRTAFSGVIIDTDQARFDVDWGYGYYVTAQSEGQSFDARVDALVVNFDDQGERIEAELVGEAET